MGNSAEYMDEIDYANIEIKNIGWNILEVGVGRRIFKTHLWDKISKGKYTGIDVVNRVKDIEGINIIEQDIREYEFKESELFDTIILAHTLEHINIGDWKDIFSKLKDVLVIGGKIIVIVPYKQKFAGYANFPSVIEDWDSAQHHVVFGIDKRILEYFLPNAEFYTKTKFIFRQDNCSIIWGLLRFIKRLFIGKYSPYRRRIFAIWEKK